MRDPATDAAALRELHRQERLLVLPNVWDVVSARLFAGVPGVSALATTSAGMAASAGCADGEVLSGQRMLREVARISDAVELPVSADLEAGYSDVTATVEAALDAGCAGINLEDGCPDAPGALIDADRHADSIAEARAVAERRGVPLVVNARTDVCWRGVGDPAGRLEASIERLRHYARAGADCVFLPGFPPPTSPDPERDIRHLVDALDGTPLNLLATTATPANDTLTELGVRRLTVGSGLYRQALANTRRAAETLLGTGAPEALTDANELPYAELAEVLRP